MAKLISRREFLKGTAAGAFSIAAASVLGTGTAAFAEEAATYTPGTYSAKAMGLESEVTVTMTFDETSITDVAIDVSGETPAIGGAIGEKMQDAILAAQSGDVDAVSGASITSNAIRTAANDCIAQAKGAAPAAAAAAEDVYAGQVVGEHVHDNDLVVNVCKAKQLTNVRASGTDEKARIIPKTVMSLEECLEYIKQDELVEVTPKSMRMRKTILDHDQRKKAAIKRE